MHHTGHITINGYSKSSAVTLLNRSHIDVEYTYLRTLYAFFKSICIRGVESESGNWIFDHMF